MARNRTRPACATKGSSAWSWLLASLIIASQLSAGCMSLSPRKETTIALSNGVTEFRGPTFVNRINWLGWGFIGATTAAGAYEGYRSNVAIRWTGWERKSEIRPFGNAALGAVAGIATGFLLTLIVGGDAPPVTSDNAAEWLEDLDDRMILMPLDTLHPGIELSSIQAISANADASFTIVTIKDAVFFLNTFPYSRRRDEALASGARRLSHKDLPDFARLVRGLPAETLAVRRYISEIPTLGEAIASAAEFPSYAADAEARAAALAKTLDDLKRFVRAFPESTLADEIASRVQGEVPRDDIPLFIDLFPSIRNRSELKRRYEESK